MIQHPSFISSQEDNQHHKIKYFGWFCSGLQIGRPDLCFKTDYLFSMWCHNLLMNYVVTFRNFIIITRNMFFCHYDFLFLYICLLFPILFMFYYIVFKLWFSQMTKFSLTIRSLGLLQCYPPVRLNVSVTWEGTSLHILQNAAKHSGKVLYKNKIKKKNKRRISIIS